MSEQRELIYIDWLFLLVEKPFTENPTTENPQQRNTNITNTKNKEIPKKENIPFSGNS